MLPLLTNTLPIPKLGQQQRGTTRAYKNVTAIDDHTVKVEFKEINPAWFLAFVGSQGMILPKHIYENFQGEKAREAPANLLPVGTGPYQVVEFKPGDVVIYQPNPYFREGARAGF